MIDTWGFYWYDIFMKYCIECGKPKSRKGKYCKSCSYKHRTRPSGLKYKIRAINKGWIKKGQRLNPDTEFKHSGKPFNHGNGYLNYTDTGKQKKHHRYMMEQFLGRKLESKEEVHHIDGNKANNNIDNLKLFSSKSEHLKYHWQTNWTNRRKRVI